MSETLFKSLVFIFIALLTIALAYLYQRRERVQAVNRIWVWPAVFTALAARSIAEQWPIDQRLLTWMSIAFVIGLMLGIARGAAFSVRSGEKPGTMILKPTLLSGSIFMIALLYNEYQHVFKWGDPQLARIACSLLVLTVGNSLAVNVVRVLNWKYSKR